MSTTVGHTLPNRSWHCCKKMVYYFLKHIIISYCTTCLRVCESWDELSSLLPMTSQTYFMDERSQNCFITQFWRICEVSTHKVVHRNGCCFNMKKSIPNLDVLVPNLILIVLTLKEYRVTHWKRCRSNLNFFIPN